MAREGGVWGDDVILESDELQLDFPALACSYLLVFTIDGGTIMHTVREFPEACAVLNKVKKRWRLTRALVREAERRSHARGLQFRGRIRPLYDKEIARRMNAVADTELPVLPAVQPGERRTTAISTWLSSSLEQLRRTPLSISRGSRSGSSRASKASTHSAHSTSLALPAEFTRHGRSRRRSVLPVMPMIWGAKKMPPMPAETLGLRVSLLVAAKQIGVDSMKEQMQKSLGANRLRPLESADPAPHASAQLVADRLEAKMERMEDELAGRMNRLEQLLLETLESHRKGADAAAGNIPTPLPLRPEPTLEAPKAEEAATPNGPLSYFFSGKQRPSDPAPLISKSNLEA